MSAYTGWTFKVAWASDPADISPSWTDETARVAAAITITRGRQAEANDIQAGTLEVVLDNADGELTALNPLSTTDVALGKRCQLRETVGANTYDRYDGYLTDIDPDAWTDSGDRAVRLTFTDRLDRLHRSPAYVSTLGAHILGAAADSLVLYHPLNDQSSPFVPIVGEGDMIMRGLVQQQPYQVPEDMVAPASVDGPPGDDERYPELTPIYFDPPTPTAGTQSMPFGTANIAVHVGATDTIALSAWIKPKPLIAALAPDLQDSFFLALTETAGAPASFGSHSILLYDRLSNVASAAAAEGVNSASALATVPFPRDVWRLVTARLSIATGALTLWVGSDIVASATLTSPATYDFLYLHIGAQYHGSIAHLQVHVGSNAFTYADHLAQVAVGMTGLERQSTGERITTLAGYAGVTDLDIDAGTTQLGGAQLAGLTPGDAMTAAATTENGDLYVTGAGTLRFRARTSRYNQAASATIAKASIDDGLRPRLDGPIINVFDATTAGGGRARSLDAASIASTGVAAGNLEIDTLQPSELIAAAKWRTSQYATQKVRVTKLPIDLLHASNAVRNAVLALDIGDRADLTGMPADYPLGADKVIIEGYAETIGTKVRRIEFVTSPVLGSPPGTPATWFKLDDSTLGELDAGNPLAY